MAGDNSDDWDIDDWDAEKWHEHLFSLDEVDEVDEVNTDRFYAEDWEKLSKEYKSSVGYICENCGINLSSNRNLLHAHHINHDKTMNEHWNLLALCIVCHSKQEGHEFMEESITAADRQIIMSLRRKTQNGT